MYFRRELRRLFFISFLVSIVFFQTNSCKKSAKTTYERLMEHINTIKVINTHEHQREPSNYEGYKHNFYTILAHSYLKSDLVSAGAAPLPSDLIKQGNLDKLWDIYGQYLNYSRNTSYYSHLIRGFQVLYGFDQPYFSKEGIELLSVKIAENYNNRERWYEKAFNSAHFEIMFVDPYWDAFDMEFDSKYFAPVFNINPLLLVILKRAKVAKKYAPSVQRFYNLAEIEKYPLKTLDDYLTFADHLLQIFKERKIVALKNASAYWRSLDFEYVPYKQAKGLFAQPPSSLSDQQEKSLVDFMFHWIIEKSIEMDLPIQIHTGYLDGNSFIIERTRPIKLNNLFVRYPKATFILFHGGYPWTGEYTALGKMFPNVYLDIVWLPQISRQAAVKTLDEMLDCVPYNKILWGGDCEFIEESVGSLEFGKDIVARVLAMRVGRGLMTEQVAKDVATKIFRENAIRIFKLKEIYNIDF